MKKTFRFCLSLLLVTLLFCSLGASAFADSVVTLAPDKKFYVTADNDLFDSFKNVMPGDTLTETITVRNQLNNGQMIYIYLQAVPHNPAIGPHVDQVKANEDYASMMDFLSQITLTVTINGKPVSQDTADKPAGLAERQLVGIFYGPGQYPVQATINVPITMGNEYADRMGEVDWVFTLEEWGRPTNLRTGDDSNMTLWIVMLSLCVVGIGTMFIILLRRKKKAE